MIIADAKPGQVIRFKSSEHDRVSKMVEVERVELPADLRIAIVFGQKVTNSKASGPCWGRTRVFSVWRDRPCEVIEELKCERTGTLLDLRAPVERKADLTTSAHRDVPAN